MHIKTHPLKKQYDIKRKFPFSHSSKFQFFFPILTVLMWKSHAIFFHLKKITTTTRGRRRKKFKFVCNIDPEEICVLGTKCIRCYIYLCAKMFVHFVKCLNKCILQIGKNIVQLHNTICKKRYLYAEKSDKL